MDVLIDTGDVPAAQRREVWRSTICDKLGLVDVRVRDQNTPLWGKIEAAHLGPVRIAKLQTSTGETTRRTPGLIRRDNLEVYRVALALDGNGRHVIAQNDQAALLSPGDFAIYDYSQPFELDRQSAYHVALMVIPHALLPLSPRQVGQLTAVTFPGRDGMGRLVSQFLRRLVTDINAYRPDTATRLSAVALDLVTTALAERLDQPAPLSAESQRRLLLTRIHSFIDQHLSDPDLTPPTIAAAHHLSLRGLHQLFADHDTTVAAWIRNRRLERCRRYLADPAWHTVPISAIAASCGLTDAAHFSKLFHRTYGTTPSQYRASQPGG